MKLNASVISRMNSPTILEHSPSEHLKLTLQWSRDPWYMEQLQDYKLLFFIFLLLDSVTR